MRSPSPHARKITRERIAILFVRAREFFDEYPAASHRCVALARRIAMRQRVRIDREFRRQFCRHCHAFLVVGRNMRVRIHRGKVIVTCRECGRQMRYPLEVRHGTRKI
ncbi:MAG TPA: ribonuclease P [Methanoregulaceae archaeon]|nr:MAG: ribonuclease P [Methanolinea sp.]HON81912.1 ribonuclease P [Methanoregulaceae archaeon]HPD10690.1 ribonuclease P [Methanoregulaceae archaeon]HRT15819.1 ribonuclease P [Methanoregulaceae archaeon]HRU31333.1 ribonuclease P [Methanoregulaceae archaeon]